MKKILLLEQRAFGDAVIATSVINRILNIDDFRIDVLCRHETSEIFENTKNISRVWKQNFWINEHKSWNIIKQWNVINKLRKQHYDYIVDIFGDVRERLIGYWCGGKKLITIAHTKDYEFDGLYKKYSDFAHNSLESLADVIYVDENVLNYYFRLELILRDIGLQFQNEIQFENKLVRVVGLHPFASQKCKEWPFENWRALIDRLLEQGKRIIVFGAPNERKILEEQFGMYCNRIELFTGSLQEFLDKLRELDLMIGLDSFSIHAAYAAGLRNIMINGANDYRMWQTPLTTVVSAHDGVCQYWPCYNKPRCNGKFSCINSITVDDVMKKVGETREMSLSDLK